MFMMNLILLIENDIRLLKCIWKERIQCLQRVFFDTVVIEKKDVERLRYIMNDKRNIKIERIKNHKELKGKELKEFIKLLK